MPINSINPTNKGNKKDLADQILQGLQIAEAGLKIPVAYEQIRAYGADADMKRDEQQGITTRAKVGAGGGVLIPRAEAESLGGPPPLVPAPEYYGPKGTAVKVRDGGNVTEELVTTQDARDKFFKNEKSLREEYTGHAVTKNTMEMYQAAQKLIGVLDKNANAPLGAADLAATYAFGKLNDPGSAVREGELDLAKKAQGGLANLGNIIDSVKKGTLYGAEGRRALKKATEDILSTQMDLQSRIDERYRGRSKEQGFKEGNIVDNPWTNADGSKPQPPPKASSQAKKADDGPKFSAAQESGIAAFMKANNLDRETAVKVLKENGRLP